ncbi:MAG: type IX secretion system sortase PorU [Runella sp.]
MRWSKKSKSKVKILGLWNILKYTDRFKIGFIIFSVRPSNTPKSSSPPLHPILSTFYFLLSTFYFLLFTLHFSQAQNSVLSAGQWYKIGVTQTGVYKIDAPFLRRMGLNPSNINPQNLRLFGNGGAMLPQPNASPRPSDLTENAVFVKGEADGRFDEGDALWFFGESPHQIRYNTTENRLEHTLNLYSDTTFYFLQINAPVAGLRIATRAAGNNGSTVSTFDDYFFRERELLNRVQSGREWWGEAFTTNTRQEYTTDISGIVADSPFKITVASVAAAQVATRFLVNVNGQNLGEQSMGTVTTFRYDAKGQRTQKTYDGRFVGSPTRIAKTFTFDKAGQNTAEGYLDFYGLQVQRQLRLYDTPTVFQNLAAIGQDSVRYVVGQVSNQLQIWDITNILNPISQLFRINGNEAAFVASGRGLRRFVAFSESQLLAPVSWQRVANQNLRALATPEMLIITAPAWQRQAQRLADFRRQNDNMDVTVVSTFQVYNDFGSGQPDPTALRDLVKYLYDRQPEKLKYLLLFGDATFDFKNNMRAFSPLQMTYFVPTYQSRESSHPVLSYASDDYFGFLRNDEGLWEESHRGNHTLSIGIGRLPVKSVAEAETVVNKIIRYQSARSQGAWRQRLVFVADDGDANLHQQDADNLSKIMANQTALYDIRKIYVDAYPQIGTTNTRAPEVNQTINRHINQGALVVNYTGHGGTTIWADEQILTLEDLFSWRNLDNLPLIITATCEFGRYDNPAEVSGAELAVVNPRGGAIAMLTTARPVYASTNFMLNEAFYRVAFRLQNAQWPRLGDMIRLTKNNSLSGVFNRNFTLLGDPSLRLHYPDYEIDIATSDTLKAGKLVQLRGQIKQGDLPRNDFNGIATVTVFNKESQRLTNGTEGASKMPFTEYDTKIFEGSVSVVQGKFTVRFVVPQNIDPKIGKGRVQVYSIKNDSLADAAGANNQIWVGGRELLTNDNKPPILKMYLNDEQFVEGSEVNDSPRLIATISDDNGINIASDMLLTLNDTLSVRVNDFFSAAKDDFRQGVLRYAFQKLPVGSYHLRLKVADPYNNWAEGTLRFRVGEQLKLIKQAIVSPNPVISNARLNITLENEGDDVEIKWQIFDAKGNLIRNFEQNIYGADQELESFIWDATNHFTQPVPNGMYFYRLEIHSLTQNHTQSVGGKLIIMK